MPEDRRLRIESNRHLGASYFLLTLSSDDDLPAWEPGQFAMIAPEGRTDPLLRRPFSIYNLHGRESPARSVQFLYKILGRGTALLAQCRPGDRIACLLPLGRGFSRPRGESRRLIMVAGGAGIASLHPLAAEEARSGSPPLLLFGCRTVDELPAADATTALGCETLVATDDGSRGFHGFVSGLLDRLLSERGARDAVVCACGPTPMMRATADVARRHGAPCLLSLESTMACGFGVCVGCVVGVRRAADGSTAYVRTCIEGPVMDAAEIVW